MLDGTRQVATVFTQRQFNEYARLSGDDNPIHVDADFAATTRFRRTVAHGMFLFSVLQAAIAQELERPTRLSSQEFVFSAPTFTGDPLLLELTPAEQSTIAQRIIDSAGTVTTSGICTLGPPDPSLPAEIELTEPATYKGLQVGMSASRSKTFTADDVADFVALVRDPNPLFDAPIHEVPPGLLAGMDSWVLGVDLPGRGTNWLKQRFVYHRPVRVPAAVTSTVTITRIRPQKGLVNLATRCTTAEGIVVSGEALVLAVDVMMRE
ncbi:MAG: MaoC/PaaZ C-terminal domain-containing protein [Acidimicrobiia bacterium]|nr:MaoC/PaaZ C-terminal domain-containing protein [Acidimicrobiia bacterium]